MLNVTLQVSNNYRCIHSSCACCTCYVMSAYMHLFHQDGGFMSSWGLRFCNNIPIAKAVGLFY